jgi:hypothetical protein
MYNAGPKSLQATDILMKIVLPDLKILSLLITRSIILVIRQTLSVKLTQSFRNSCD